MDVQLENEKVRMGRSRAEISSDRRTNRDEEEGEAA